MFGSPAPTGRGMLWIVTFDTLPAARVTPRAANAGGGAVFGPSQSGSLLLHIGFHKAGSTWLQQHVFDDTERGLTLPTGQPRHRLVEQIVTPDPLAYDAAAVAGAYRAHREGARQRGLGLVLSHERLSGYPSSGGRDRQMIAERLHATFPDARVLIVIREQRALIRSMYSQHITDGGVESLARFLRTPEPALCRKPSFSLDFYAFDRLIALYQRLFTPERVLVLALEQLARDPQRFVDAISDFTGAPRRPLTDAAPSNERRPLIMQQVQRPLNMLLYHNELSPGALFHVPRFHKRFARLRPLFEALVPTALDRMLDRRLRAAIDRHVGDAFADSNRQTEILTGLPLRTLGYPVTVP